MTQRLLTWGDGEMEELSIMRETLSVLDKVDLVPINRWHAQEVAYNLGLGRHRTTHTEVHMTRNTGHGYIYIQRFVGWLNNPEKGTRERRTNKRAK